jgi:DHA3 family macrolide efflux protein-like MFS transporter
VTGGAVPESRPVGMRTFILIWIGQALSLLGSGMTAFGLSIWAWEKTGQATALALVGFFFTGATMAASPFAGALVDRLNRKAVLVVSDLAAATSTVVLLVLYASGRLEIWHLFVANAWSGAFQALQWPAYSATITLLVPKQHYTRTSAMMSLAESSGFVFSPILAAVLLRPIGLAGIMVIDVATMSLAVGTLLMLRIPQPKTSAAGREGQGSFWQESVYGFRYIFTRPSLLGLQLVFFVGNLLSTFAWTLFTPLILTRTGNNELALGSVQSAMGFGAVAGGLVLSIWGGPRRRVHGVLLGWAVTSLLGQLVFGLGHGPTFWAVVGFLSAFIAPVVDASNQAIWQAKVAPDVQGRVFSTRRLIAQLSIPLAMLMAGPLADHVFEPAMRGEGVLVPLFGRVVGSGPGAGMALMIVFSGLLGFIAGLAGYLFRPVRDAGTLLPDHDEKTV